MGMTIRPPDISELQSHVDAQGLPLLQAWQQQVAEMLAKQAHRIEQLERMVFGPRSEKITPIQQEVSRQANAAEVEALARRLAEADGRTEPSPQDEQTARRKIGRAASEATRAKQSKARAESAPILEQTIEVSEEDIPDGMSFDEFRRLGQGETRTIVSYVKGHYVIKRYTLQTMQHMEQSNVIVQAKMPERSLVAGGKYDVTCYTQCVLSRILDVMPLQRQARQSARAGYTMAPSVLVNLFHRSAFLLTGVYQQIVQQLQQADFICGDETPQPMLAPGKGKTVRGWMWMALCDTAIAYHFDVSRSTEAGKNLLGGSVKNLLVDGYSGYNAIGVNRYACWSHVRRGLFEVRENWPVAQEILREITSLYRVEFHAGLQEKSGEQLRDIRRARSRPILDRIFDLARYEVLAHSPTSVQALALNYLVKRESELRKFVEDPRAPLDNTISERALRIVAIGRKNSLFVGPEDNGQDLAILLTVVQTCQLLNVDTNAYFNDVLPRLYELQGETDTAAKPRFASLTPAAWAKSRNAPDQA